MSAYTPSLMSGSKVSWNIHDVMGKHLRSECGRSASAGLSFLIHREVIICTQPQRHLIIETLSGAHGMLDTACERGERGTGPGQPERVPRKLGVVGVMTKTTSQAGDCVLCSQPAHVTGGSSMASPARTHMGKQGQLEAEAQSSLPMEAVPWLHGMTSRLPASPN